MTTDTQRINAMTKIVNARGMAALKNARQTILVCHKEDRNIAKALRHFSDITLKNALPVFPALISLSCEAMGGSPEKTIAFGEAFVLITCAADLHDDVIDESLSKGGRQTVFGKFGPSLTLLAGDILLVEGTTEFCLETERLDRKRKLLINNLFKNAIAEICVAEGLETQLRERHLDVSSNEYNKVINHRAVVPELSMKIGAILGCGKPEDIGTLGQIGRTFGTVSTIIEEFDDIFELEQLKNRLENCCPPLPLIYALETQKSKKALVPLLATKSLDTKTHEQMVQSIFSSNKVVNMHKTLTALINSELSNIRYSKWKKQDEIETLLLALLCYLNNIYSSS